MLPKPTAEQIVYGLLLVLGALVLLLLALAPPEFLNNKIVYQGF
jgi:hypothetical protein